MPHAEPSWYIGAMSRQILSESNIHPGIQDKVAAYHRGIVEEVQQASAENDYLVVGMKQNPHCRKARKLLESRGIEHRYIEYGSYLGEWRRRSALKMWTGWPTFPMVFYKGTLVGGASELGALLESETLSA
jgi:glutaredoxin-related protein